MLSHVWEPAKELGTSYQRALIYMICGNPGLIGYYVDFLDALRNLLDSSQGSTAYDIFGRNLAGFIDSEHEPFAPDNPPFDVDAQVRFMYQDVASRRIMVEHGGGSSGKPYDFVILMGHSIGAYIGVEMFHRHMRDPGQASHLNLRHGILLFPTIASMAMSRAGTRFNYIRSLPSMELNLVKYAKGILGLFSQSALCWIIQNIMGFSAHTAHVTSEWLKSRDGVHEALHMGKCEMDTIMEDTWGDELWEASVMGAGAQSVPRFFMFYGKEDHWVANHVRDSFIEKRCKKGTKGEKVMNTRIQVDDGALPHAFCTKEGKSLAKID